MGKFKELMMEQDDRERFLMAVEEAASLEPLADENGVPAYNDYKGLQEIAKANGINYESFLQHLDWINSNGLCGKKFTG
jgi:hypothetical protein